MKQEKLIQLTNECIERDKEYIQKLIKKAIASGCMDIDGAEDNYILPKNLLTAIYQEMSRQYAPLSGDKRQAKNVKNIFIHL